MSIQTHGHNDDGRNGTPGAVGNQYLTLWVADQMFGIPVLRIQEVIGHQRTTRIPLAPAQVAGSLNLRGRIVTAIDVRTRLGLERIGSDAATMNIVVEHNGDVYSLVVDSVGEVVSIDENEFEEHPPTVAPNIRAVSHGVYRLDETLLLAADIESLLDFGQMAA